MWFDGLIWCYEDKTSLTLNEVVSSIKRLKTETLQTVSAKTIVSSAALVPAHIAKVLQRLI